MERRLPPKRSSSQEVDAPRVKSWEVELRKPRSGDRLQPALASAEGSREAWETRSLSLASRMPEQGYLHIRIVVEGGGDQAG